MDKNTTIQTPEIIVDPFEDNAKQKPLSIVDPFESVSDVDMFAEPTRGEKAKAFAYGAGTGLAGGLGELEKFGAYTVPDFARKLVGAEPSPRENMGFGRETLFPTVEEVRKGLGKIGIERPREEVRGYETGGEILGGFGTAIQQLKQIKGQIKVYEEQSDILETAIRGAMQNYGDIVSVSGETLVTWRSAKVSKRFSSDLFKQSMPEVYEQFVVEMPGSRRFLVK